LVYIYCSFIFVSFIILTLKINMNDTKIVSIKENITISFNSLLKNKYKINEIEIITIIKIKIVNKILDLISFIFNYY